MHIYSWRVWDWIWVGLAGGPRDLCGVVHFLDPETPSIFVFLLLRTCLLVCNDYYIIIRINSKYLSV